MSSRLRRGLLALASAVMLSGAFSVGPASATTAAQIDIVVGSIDPTCVATAADTADVSLVLTSTQNVTTDTYIDGDNYDGFPLTAGTPKTVYLNPLGTGDHSFVAKVYDPGAGASYVAGSLTFNIPLCEQPPSNHAPVANNDTASTLQDAAVTVDVLANDTDADGNSLTVTNASTPSHGTATVVNNAVQYTPPSGYTGTDSFTYQVSDGTDTATATVTVSVDARVEFSLSDFSTAKECVKQGEVTDYTYVAHTNVAGQAGVYVDEQLVDAVSLTAGDNALSSVNGLAAGDHVLKLSLTTKDGQKVDATLNVTVPACNTPTPTPGDNGDVKVHKSGFPTDDQRNQPKVCTFYFDAFGFDGVQQVTWWVKAGPNFKGESVLSGTIKLNENGHGYTPDYNLPNGQYKLFWTFDGENGKAKQKVFKVDCAATPTPTPTSSDKNPVVVTSSPQCADQGKANGVGDVTVTNPYSHGLEALVTRNYTVKVAGQTQHVDGLVGGASQTAKFTLAAGTYTVTVTEDDDTSTTTTTLTVAKCPVSSPTPTPSATMTGGGTPAPVIVPSSPQPSHVSSPSATPTWPRGVHAGQGGTTSQQWLFWALLFGGAACALLALPKPKKARVR